MVWCVVVELHSLELIQPSTPDPVQLYNMIDPGDELTCVLCGACICIVQVKQRSGFTQVKLSAMRTEVVVRVGMAASV